MQITEQHITVRELYNGYKDSGDDGVIALDEQLDIRPPYQREFIYKIEQQKAVIDTVLKGCPLNVFYWAVRKPDANNPAKYEILDGQQRTLSLMRFLDGKYTVDINEVEQSFANLPDDVQNRILDYELLVYICDGTESERLEWFERINIAGEALNRQELLNAVYSGTWITSAKQWFSKPNGTAAQLSEHYVKRVAIRQEYLELALKWIARRDDTTIETYMNDRAKDANAQELIEYYERILNWAKRTFPEKREREQSKVDWAKLYDENGTRTDLDPAVLETRVAELMADEEVTSKPGIYEYVLNGNERALSIRSFTDDQKREAYERQDGICLVTGKHYAIDEMEADHIIPWSQGGKTTIENCQMLSKKANRDKSNRGI